jgi:hypothetical protein
MLIWLGLPLKGLLTFTRNSLTTMHWLDRIALITGRIRSGRQKKKKKKKNPTLHSVVQVARGVAVSNAPLCTGLLHTVEMDVRIWCRNLRKTNTSHETPRSLVSATSTWPSILKNPTDKTLHPFNIIPALRKKNPQRNLRPWCTMHATSILRTNKVLVYGFFSHVERISTTRLGYTARCGWS